MSEDDANSTPAVTGRQVAPMIDRIDLVVIGGPDKGRAIHATSKRCVVGTGDCADLVLSDPTVSRYHCEIVLEQGRAIVRDLASKNGTLVDGVAIVAAPLSDGAALTLGKTTIRFAREPGALQPLMSTRDRFGALVGRSIAMRTIFAVLERAAASDATTVLLRGETGTGKDLTAASIHQESVRRDAPFVIVDLAAAPGPLLASDLFGHVKGAFTGAERDREGAFERANGGTVFLDEIGDLDPDLQPQLLRVLETKTVQRIGSSTRIPVDVRVIAATHRDLRADVNTRRFRADLYYRLAVLEITLPPLRERSDDIPLLVEAMAADLDQPAAIRDPTWVAALLKHPWPGNVRELRNHVERAVGLGRNSTSGSEIDVSIPLKEARNRWVQLFESRYLAELLRAHKNNVSAAARAAGIDRVHFYRLLGRAGLR